MQLPITINAVRGTRLQHQLVDQVRELIARGILLPGTRLPSSRELADQLGLSRRTVVLSYERLIDDGLIETRPALGTFVCSQLPIQCIRVGSSAVDPERANLVPNAKREEKEGMQLFLPAKDRLPLDFRIGKPDQHLFPHNLWRRLTSEHFDTFSKAVVDYTDPSGHPLLRQAIAKHLRTARGIVCRPEQVIVTAGAQEGLNLIARLVGLHGKEVVVEDPCYRGAALAFTSLGGELVPATIRDDGLDIDELPEQGACLAYVTPSHQFPLGVTMSADRRRALIAWARRTGTLLVEDDYDSDFRHNSTPLVALQALGPECVVYLGTFSKSIGPGLRLGYAIFPEHLAADASGIKSIMNNGHPWLEQAVTAQFISSGVFEQHLGRMRKCYLERRDTLMRTLVDNFPSTSISGFEGGMHLVWQLSETEPSADNLQILCRSAGVGIYSLANSPTYRIINHDEHERLVLLGYAGLTSAQILEAVKRVKRVADGKLDVYAQAHSATLQPSKALSSPSHR
jgi:GntR family transcriptional regulator/MocR family aminotransferase